MPRLSEARPQLTTFRRHTQPDRPPPALQWANASLDSHEAWFLYCLKGVPPLSDAPYKDRLTDLRRHIDAKKPTSLACAAPSQRPRAREHDSGSAALRRVDDL
jgi:hypothetical protein